MPWKRSWIPYSFFLKQVPSLPALNLHLWLLWLINSSTFWFLNDPKSQVVPLAVSQPVTPAPCQSTCSTKNDSIQKPLNKRVGSICFLFPLVFLLFFSLFSFSFSSSSSLPFPPLPLPSPLLLLLPLSSSVSNLFCLLHSFILYPLSALPSISFYFHISSLIWKILPIPPLASSNELSFQS